MTLGLGGVRQAARERKQERFTALLHHSTSIFFETASYALKRQASPGVDGVNGRSRKPDLRTGLGDCTARFTVERTGHNLQHGSIYRRPTGGNVRWASQRWRTKSFSSPW